MSEYRIELILLDEEGETEMLVTKSRLRGDLGKLGLCRGDHVMLHVSVKSIGWVVGGPDVVIDSILEALGPDGTLMMMIGSEDGTYEIPTWPQEKRKAYLDECPPFDPARTRAYRKYSILTEYLRTWPGAYRSRHPDGSFAAVGSLAQWITKDQPLQYGYGPGSPLAKLCDIRGKVLLLGSPETDVTLLHYSEHMADVPGKQVYKYPALILRNGAREWIEIEEFDTNCLRPGYDQGECFSQIIRDFVAAGKASSGKLGTQRATCSTPHLFIHSRCRGWRDI